MLIFMISLQILSRVGVNDVPVEKFNSKLILKRWLKSGKRHVIGHRSENKTNLKELEATENEFFIDLTTKFSVDIENENETAY